jgi:hypothetical protein
MRSRRILDGANLVLLSSDWGHPTAETLTMPPFRVFANKLQYAYRYYNGENRTIFEATASDRRGCLAVGYFFPRRVRSGAGTAAGRS